MRKERYFSSLWRGNDLAHRGGELALGMNKLSHGASPIDDFY